MGGLHGDPGPGGRRRRVQPPPPGPLGRRCRGGRGVSQASGLLRPFLPSPLRERAGLGALGERGRGPGPRGLGSAPWEESPGPVPSRRGGGCHGGVARERRPCGRRGLRRLWGPGMRSSLCQPVPRARTGFRSGRGTWRDPVRRPHWLRVLSRCPRKPRPKTSRWRRRRWRRSPSRRKLPS